MHEILDRLPEQAVVVDLGSATGSFDASRHGFRTIRADLEAGRGAGFVQADAARLPFADHSFDAVICNHSLEHFEELEGAVREIGRVVKADGALYVSAPDARTFMDRLYRWLARGGGLRLGVVLRRSEGSRDGEGVEQRVRTMRGGARLGMAGGERRRARMGPDAVAPLPGLQHAELLLAGRIVSVLGG